MRYNYTIPYQLPKGMFWCSKGPHWYRGLYCQVCAGTYPLIRRWFNVGREA